MTKPMETTPALTRPVEIVDSLVTWKKWGRFEVDNKKTDTPPEHRYMQADIEGTLQELLEKYLLSLNDLPLHSFNCNWHYAQFADAKEHLEQGELQQVLDFGQNYLCVAQDAPQGLHWDHDQVVLHPIVNHYRDKLGDLITEEHLMISSDRVYDKFAVKTFEEISLAEIKKSISIK